MKKISVMAILIAAATVFTIEAGCSDQVRINSNRNYTSRTVDDITAPFDAIEVTGSIDVEYSVSPNVQIMVYGPDNIIPLVEVTSAGGVLKVKLKDKVMIVGDHDTRVIVAAPAIKSARVSGSGDVKLRGPIQATGFDIGITGSGDVECHGLTCENLTVALKGSGDAEVKGVICTDVRASIDGSGDIELGGTASKAELTVKGSGDIDADDLVAETVIARVNGSGDISCHATSSLTADVSGSGEIEYRGNPGQLNLTGRKGAIRRDM